MVLSSLSTGCLLVLQVSNATALEAVIQMVVPVAKTTLAPVGQDNCIGG